MWSQWSCKLKPAKPPDFQANEWEALSPTGSIPSARYAHTAVWSDTADGFRRLWWCQSLPQWCDTSKLRRIRERCRKLSSWDFFNDLYLYHREVGSLETLICSFSPCTVSGSCKHWMWKLEWANVKVGFACFFVCEVLRISLETCKATCRLSGQWVGSTQPRGLHSQRAGPSHSCVVGRRCRRFLRIRRLWWCQSLPQWCYTRKLHRIRERCKTDLRQLQRPLSLPSQGGRGHLRRLFVVSHHAQWVAQLKVGVGECDRSGHASH